MTAVDDQACMARAVQLAAQGRFTTAPNPQVGCVVARDGQIVGEGWHQRAGGPHAEIVALEDAADQASGATVYVTLEPCCHQGRTPPCTDALIAAGVARVVYGSTDPNPAVAGQGARQLEEAGIAVEGGVMSAECDALNTGYLHRHRTGRPYVRCKIAASLDGRTALGNGISQWITGAAARADVQRLRARSGAILTGIGTVLADDPSLNVRDVSLGDIRQPERMIVDSQLRLPAAARTLKLDGTVRVFCVDDAAAGPLRAAGAEVERIDGQGGRVSLPALIERLSELHINDLLVEAGPTLNGALLAGGLIDELIVYTASHILGHGARGMFELPDLDAMEQRTEWQLVDFRRVGADCRATYRPQS